MAIKFFVSPVLIVVSRTTPQHVLFFFLFLLPFCHFLFSVLLFSPPATVTSGYATLLYLLEVVQF